MTLVAGTRLGPYEITAPLGAGGMGEVYRAKDTRLGRDVAIKVLPAALNANAESRARFEREARTVSSLNHPHICSLFDVGREGETDYLVLELIEGETLAARLLRAPLPPPEVLRLGAQIADALDRAHRAGVIHRDLKPGNVMLTKAGAKLMDFGLARATGLAAAPSSGSVVTMAPSPTVGPLTAEGTVVGTFQYMAPEQLEGREADARSDLWALGCLLYEMATGRRAFDGATQASVISAIMRDMPRPLGELVPMSPPALDRLVTALLAKDPDERVQTAHDAKLQLQWAAEGAGSSSAARAAAAGAGSGRARGLRAAFPWVALALAVVGLAAAWSAREGARRADTEPVVLAMPMPEELRIVPFWTSSALSPDGHAVLTRARDGRGVALWRWRLDGSAPVRVEGTEEGALLAWSPDSREFAFFDRRRNALTRLPIGGGSPTRVCGMNDSRGIAWGTRGTILFALADGPLLRVPAGGGTPVAATKLDSARGEASHRWPRFLPDGKRFLFTALPGENGFPIYAGELGSSKVKHVFDAECMPEYAAPGYLIFVAGGRIVAQRFDASRSEVRGERIPLFEAPTSTDFTAEPVATASTAGRLLFPSLPPQLARLEWFDRSGASQGEVDLPAGDWDLRGLTRDGRIAFAFRDGALWRIDLERAVATKLLPTVFTPIGVSPDGSRLAINPSVRPVTSATLISTSGTGRPDSLRTVPALFQEVVDWSPDGTSLLMAVLGQKDGTTREGSWDLWRVPLDGTTPPAPWLATIAFERFGRISPDGRWVFCLSIDDGVMEAFIDSYPVAGRRLQVFSNRSEAYYDQIAWGAGGREVIYADQDRAMWSLPLDFTGGEIRAGTPRRLFPAPGNGQGIAMRTPDGQRFLFSRPVGQANLGLRVAVNWQGTLAR